MDFKTWAAINLDEDDSQKIIAVAKGIIDYMKKEKLTQGQAGKVLESVQVLLNESYV